MSCRLVSQERIRYAGQAATLSRYQCPDAQEGDPWAPARLLERLGANDSSNDRIRSLAGVLSRRGSARSFPQRIHAYVRDHIAFRPERTELFLAPWILAASGKGDCDDSERLVRALASAANIRSRYVFATTQGSPTHVTVQLWDRGAWRWAEVTVPAYYDEHPLAALQRLGIRRPDIDRDFVTMPPFPLLGSLASLKKTLGQVDLSNFTLPSYIDGGDGSSFVQTLIAQTSGVIDDPKSALALMLHESGLEPFADNGAAVGIFQLDPYDPNLTNMSRAAFKNLTAEEQLPFAATFWRRMARSFNLLLPLAGRDLYWTNFLPATVVPAASDDHVIADNTDTIFLADGRGVHLTGAYTDNTVLDHGGKGFINAADMGLALQDGANQHPKTFAYLSNLIDAQGGGSSGASPGIVALLLGIGAGVAYEWLKRT